MIRQEVRKRRYQLLSDPGQAWHAETNVRISRMLVFDWPHGQIKSPEIYIPQTYSRPGSQAKTSEDSI